MAALTSGLLRCHGFFPVVYRQGYSAPESTYSWNTVEANRLLATEKIERGWQTGLWGLELDDL